MNILKLTKKEQRKEIYRLCKSLKNKKGTIEKIGNTYFADSSNISNINLLRVDDRWPKLFKRKKKKRQGYKRIGRGALTKDDGILINRRSENVTKR